MTADLIKLASIAATAWLICLAAMWTADIAIRRRQMLPFRHGYRNYGHDGTEVFLFEFKRGTKVMRVWASDVVEAEGLATIHKFRGPYERIIVRPQGVIGEPTRLDERCEGR